MRQRTNLDYILISRVSKSICFSIFLLFSCSNYTFSQSTSDGFDSMQANAMAIKQRQRNNIQKQEYFVRCGTVDMQDRIYGDKMNQRKNNFEQFISSGESCDNMSEVLTIPVVFHIIHDGDAIGVNQNISNQFIQEQIKQANQDFRKIAGTTGDGAGVDTRIQFALATIDPFGNAVVEPGIDRVDISSIAGSGPYSMNTIDDIIKAPTIWNPNLYFNVWTMDISGGILGYAQFPDAPSLPGIGSQDNPATTDGIVVLYGTVGSTDLASSGPSQYNAGRTWTHEAGHFFGLRHIWGNGDCSVDDFCSDTPNAASPTNGCPIKDTCPADPGIDQIENYMDYTDDVCVNTFTACQTGRMRLVLGCESIGSPRRRSLFNSNLVANDGLILLTNNFEIHTISTSTAIVDFSLIFSPSYSGTVTLSTSEIPNTVAVELSNTVVTSSSNESLTLSQLNDLLPGKYDFTIKAVDESGNEQILDITLVIDPTCLVFEDFENNNTPDGWTFEVTGNGSPTWEFNNMPFGTGSFQSFENPGSSSWVYYDDDATNFTGLNNIATATTPNYDLSSLTNIKLSFDYNFQHFFGFGRTRLIISDGALAYFYNGTDWVLTSSDWLTDDSVNRFESEIPADLDFSNISISIIYDDDNGFAEGYGFDNFALCQFEKNTIIDIVENMGATQNIIPTMGQWGMSSLFILLLIFSIVYIKDTQIQLRS